MIRDQRKDGTGSTYFGLAQSSGQLDTLSASPPPVHSADALWALTDPIGRIGITPFANGGGYERFTEERAKVIRSMASTADPFTKLRLLALAQKYERQLGKPSRAVREIQTPAGLPPVDISSSEQ